MGVVGPITQNIVGTVHNLIDGIDFLSTLDDFIHFQNDSEVLDETDAKVNLHEVDHDSDNAASIQQKIIDHPGYINL